MKLDLTRYRQPLQHFDRTFEAEEVADPGDAYRVATPVELAFEIHKDKDLFRLVGSVKAELELTCSRCLEPLRFPVAAQFDLRYLPATRAIDEPERELREEDIGTSYYEQDELDLNELIREQFYLVLPMKPLCREDCQGLCPQCGVNRNTGTCECSLAWEDPRLAALKGLGRSRES